MCWNLRAGVGRSPVTADHLTGMADPPSCKGPCRPPEREEETEVPSEANTVDAELVPEKAFQGHAPCAGASDLK